MTLAFNWGTVSDATSSSSAPQLRLAFTRNLTFSVSHTVATEVARYSERKISAAMFHLTGGPTSLCFPTPTGFLHLAWDPMVIPLTAKSVLKVGEGAPSAQLAPGTTPTLLDRDEANELAGAIRKLAP